VPVSSIAALSEPSEEVLAPAAGGAAEGVGDYYPFEIIWRREFTVKCNQIVKGSKGSKLSRGKTAWWNLERKMEVLLQKSLETPSLGPIKTLKLL